MSQVIDWQEEDRDPLVCPACKVSVCSEEDEFNPCEHLVLAFSDEGCFHETPVGKTLYGEAYAQEFSAVGRADGWNEEDLADYNMDVTECEVFERIKAAVNSNPSFDYIDLLTRSGCCSGPP